jgi:hypothetical protein
VRGAVQEVERLLRLAGGAERVGVVDEQRAVCGNLATPCASSCAATCGWLSICAAVARRVNSAAVADAVSAG